MVERTLRMLTRAGPHHHEYLQAVQGIEASKNIGRSVRSAHGVHQSRRFILRPLAQ